MSAYWRTQFSCNVLGTYAAVQTTENPFSCIGEEGLSSARQLF